MREKPSKIKASLHVDDIQYVMIQRYYYLLPQSCDNQPCLSDSYGKTTLKNRIFIRVRYLLLLLPSSGRARVQQRRWDFFSFFFLNFQSSSLSLSCCEGWMALVLLQRTSEHSKKQKKSKRERERERRWHMVKITKTVMLQTPLALIALHDFCIFLCL